jgi:ABC-type uncharacterized transport system permease subunit
MIKKYRDILIGAVLLTAAIILNRYNIISGFFLGLFYGAGIALLMRTLVIKIREK